MFYSCMGKCSIVVCLDLIPLGILCPWSGYPLLCFPIFGETGELEAQLEWGNSLPHKKNGR